MMRPTMIMEMCTAPAMMPAPTMKVMPEKIRGTCETYTPIQHHVGEKKAGEGSLVLLL